MANPFDQFDAPPTLKERDIEAGIGQSGASAANAAASAEETRALLPDKVRAQKATADKAETEARELAAKVERELAAGGRDKDVNARIPRLRSLVEQINRVETLYGQNIAPEPLGVISSVGDYLPTDANAQFDTAGAQLSEKGLAAFRVPGTGTVSDRDAIMFEKANLPTASTRDIAIEEQLRGLRARVDEEFSALGIPAPEWIAGVQDEGDEGEPAVAAAKDAEPTGSDGGAPPETPAPPKFSPGDPQYQAATGEGRRNFDPKLAAEINAKLRAGASYKELNDYVLSIGGEPINRQQYGAARAYLRKNPAYEGSMVDAYRYEPLSAYEKAITTIGDNSAGAYAMNAGQFLSGNTLDNLAADPERARMAMDISRARNPTASAIGDVTGGVLATLGGEAGLARLGMAPGLIRGALADAAMGGANAAGMADEGDRLTAGGLGALESMAGGVGGNLATRGIARAISPTGGAYKDLYEAGVRPTIGQRVANANDGKGFRGMVGRTANATEEALQSVPIVGSAIRGARQEARDQFQIGAFNEALKEIGETLPKTVRPGNEPHKLVQESFRRVYDQARSGMRFIADQDFANDIVTMVDDINALGPEARTRFSRIMENRVNNRVRDGVADGDDYKRMVSGLDRQIAALGRDPQSSELTDVLRNIKSAIEGAARRHSDPAAVELLDAADAGYAKLVRIEDAASRRGGDSGEFSPAQFDAAVQKTSGGVRSKAYLRGDALMQDYAKAGRGLEDRMPNSGTTDRALIAGGAAGVAGYLEPSILSLLGTIGTAYAPGVRKLTKGAMKPGGPKARAIARQLEKRARLAGRVGAASSVALLPGTSPGQ